MKGNGPFFLSIDGKDPSDTFMTRFVMLNVPPKKESESYFKKEPFPGWLRDRSTDEKAMMFSVGYIRWKSVHRVEVHGGCTVAAFALTTEFIDSRRRTVVGRWMGTKCRWFRS